MLDDFVKSLSAALRCILSHCGVPVSTPHSFVFARLASESFYFVVRYPTFYGIIIIDWHSIVPTPMLCGMGVLLWYDRQENVGWVGLIVVNGVGGLYHFFLIKELTPRIGVNVKPGIVAA